MFRRHPLTAGAWLCAHLLPLSLGILAPGCLVDLDQRCGTHQRYNADQGVCACDEGFMLSGNACVVCDESCDPPATGDGSGLPCTSDDDCAGQTASYCETVSAHACLVNDCAPDPSKCQGDWVCCDIALLTQSLCLPPDELEDGACPAGGTIVPREK